MYRMAYSQDENTIVYLDKSGNKHIRKGGNLSWRINNPGLVRSHSHYAFRHGSIGCLVLLEFAQNAKNRIQDIIESFT